jgi:branched-chain amino acid transport system ATP-binding protein
MSELLSIHQLSAGYGTAQVLFSVDLSVGTREVLAVIGRNGMGKSTLVRTILGLTVVSAGKIHVAGKDVTGWSSHRVARAGVGWVPEGRQIFAGLTIEENLLVSARKGMWTVEKVYGLFPRLQERRQHFGNQISGGEQQMLAIGRALLTQPTILMLDEATEGLAPLIRVEIWRTLDALKASGQSAIIVDRDLDALSKLADRFVVVEKGRIAFSGNSTQLKTDRAAIEQFIHV